MNVSGANKFWGEFEVGADERGRFLAPQEFRAGLGEEFVITRGPDRVALLVPNPVWQTIETRLYSDPITSPSRILQRLFASRYQISADSRGRITIPRNLQNWMQQSDDREMTLLGQGSCIEVWDRKRWLEYQENFTSANIIDAAKALDLQEVFKL